MPTLEPYGVIGTHDPSRVSFKVTLQSTSQTSSIMFDASRTIAFAEVKEKLEKHFSETSLEDLELIWKDKGRIFL